MLHLIIYVLMICAALSSLQKNASEDDFELNAYEAILSTTKQLITEECNICNSKVMKITSILRTGSLLPIEVQENMRTAKNTISSLLAKCNTYIRFLTDVLEDDELMALMNLTKLKKNPALYKYYALHMYIYSSKYVNMSAYCLLLLTLSCINTFNKHNYMNMSDR